MGLTLYLTQMKVCPISRCASWSDYDPWLRPDSDKVGIRNAEIHIVISREPLINVCEAVSARQKSAKKRSL